MITVKNLHKQFDSIHALNGIDEVIEKGEKNCRHRPLGLRQKHVLRCLNLLEVPSEGEIWFEGNLITDEKVISTSCAKRWAWCFSSSICFRTRRFRKTLRWPLRF